MREEIPVKTLAVRQVTFMRWYKKKDFAGASLFLNYTSPEGNTIKLQFQLDESPGNRSLVESIAEINGLVETKDKYCRTWDVGPDTFKLQGWEGE